MNRQPIGEFTRADAGILFNNAQGPDMGPGEAGGLLYLSVMLFNRPKNHSKLLEHPDRLVRNIVGHDDLLDE